MEHLLACGCGRKIRVSRSQAGQELSCECGQKLQVPTLRGFADLPVAQSETLSTSTSERRAWGGWRGTILAISVAMFALSIIPCGYYLNIRRQIDTSYDVDDEIEAGNLTYDAVPFESLVAEWSNFERTGLGPKDKPAFYFWKLYARENEILAAITGTVAAVSAITVVGLWISAPKKAK
jgi:hypothetical protein